MRFHTPSTIIVIGIHSSIRQSRTFYDFIWDARCTELDWKWLMIKISVKIHPKGHVISSISWNCYIVVKKSSTCFIYCYTLGIYCLCVFSVSFDVGHLTSATMHSSHIAFIIALRLPKKRAAIKICHVPRIPLWL